MTEATRRPVSFEAGRLAVAARDRPTVLVDFDAMLIAIACDGDFHRREFIREDVTPDDLFESLARIHLAATVAAL